MGEDLVKMKTVRSAKGMQILESAEVVMDPGPRSRQFQVPLCHRLPFQR